MTKIDNWDVTYILTTTSIVILIMLFIVIFRIYHIINNRIKCNSNNNHLLKPNTKYGINVDHNYITIDDRKYRYSLDIDALGLDRDGDAIITGKNPRSVTRYPNIRQESIVLISIFDEIKE